MTYQAQTKQKWLSTVSENATVLRKLITDYHPSARHPKAYEKEAVLFTDGDVVEVDSPQMVITAPEAERACQNVRQSIRKEHPEDPLEKWDKAVSSGDVETISSLLSSAWFGMPESTECWDVPGFNIMCDLLDDTPEEEANAG